MRVLIVGCGYVGMALGAALARLGHSVTGVRRSPAAAGLMRAAGIEPVIADVSSPNGLAGLSGEFDHVVHCVAASGGGVEDYRCTYYEGTRCLLERFVSRPPQRWVYTSSTGVYGQTDGSTVTEDSPTPVTTPTAQVLLETEQLLLEVARECGFPAIILRLSGIYGPGRGYWLKQYLSGEARLEGTGERVLNMIHRDDVVNAILSALERGQPGRIYNVTDDEPVTQREMFQWLAAFLNRPLPPTAPVEAAGARRRGLTSKRISNQRLRVELGCRLRYPTFREGFAAELEALGIKSGPTPARAERSEG